MAASIAQQFQKCKKRCSAMINEISIALHRYRFGISHDARRGRQLPVRFGRGILALESEAGKTQNKTNTKTKTEDEDGR